MDNMDKLRCYSSLKEATVVSQLLAACALSDRFVIYWPRKKTQIN